MTVAKARHIGRVACAGFWMTVLASAPASAQELNLIDMFQTMGTTAIAVAVVLFIMSFWSIGVAIERVYTYNKARQQSKLYAPQVAKHLKDGRLKEAIALSGSKDFRYSHLAKVVMAGLQEYQFQQESGGSLNREDVLDTVRRSIQRASALTASDLKKGTSALATIGSTAERATTCYSAAAATISLSAGWATMPSTPGVATIFWKGAMEPMCSTVDRVTTN